MAVKAKKTTKSTKPTKSTKVAKTSKASSPVRATSNAKFACFGIVTAVILAVIIAVVCTVVIRNNVIDDSYFVSDNTKYVLNMTADEDDDSALKAVHTVYYYKDNQITGAKSYYEFEDAASAKAAYEEAMADQSEDAIKSYKLKGKYIVFTASESEYGQLTVDGVKAQIELYERYKNGELQDLTE